MQTSLSKHFDLYTTYTHKLVCILMSATVEREMLASIIFGGFENITIWQRFNLEILLDESG